MRHLLVDSPNRFNGLYGAGRAAQLGGDYFKAGVFYQKLVKICAGGDGGRAELQRAGSFFENKSVFRV
jgi:hypothetical protein